ncbi:unnamed protein product [Allacma fusca]|uniref:Uncharacterized protein n=1 Tax=Allacma fusca TaxID=39272 RepID=A0A8J2JRG7_9HEXA|nr:unnamed protein product [Allacma fusca]
MLHSIIKACLIAVLCSAGVFLTVEANAVLKQPDWDIFQLARTIDPDSIPETNTWGIEDWYDLLHQKEKSVSEVCSGCLSVKDTDLNVVFVARPEDIIEGFPPVTSPPVNYKAAWSTRTFDTYILYRNNVFTCGGLYFLAEVDENGMPVEALILDDTLDRLDAIKFKCENIEVRSDANDDLQNGLELEFGGNIPATDVVPEVPENYFLRIMPGNVVFQKQSKS